MAYNPGTYEMPCSYSGARYHLSELTGISQYNIITVGTLDELRIHNPKAKRKSRLKYPSERITVVDSAGGEHEYHTPAGRFDQRDIEAIHFFVEIPRSIEEFGLDIKVIDENYKIDEGGGWHSVGVLYCVGDKIYYHS